MEELINELLILQAENKRINTELDITNKGLQAIHQISSLFKKTGFSLEKFFKQIVNLIPSGWQFPEITCARIIFEKQEFKTTNFHASKWKQTEIIHNTKTSNASIEVYYLVEKPVAYEGPFLKEEREILKVLAKILGKIIDTKYLINELEDSNEKFEISFQKSPVAKCLVDKSDNFKFLDVNETFISLTGFSREELEGQHLPDINFFSTEIINSVLVPKINRKINVKDFEINFRNKLGNNKTGLINIETIFLKSKEIILVAITDISEQKKTQNRIFESEKRLQSIFENMQDAYFQADLEGNFSYFNPMALQMYGYDSYEELLCKPSSMLYANLKEREDLLNKLHKDGKVKDFTGTALRKDGTTFNASMNAQFFFDSDGNIAGIQAVVRDITDRANYGKKVLENEQKYRSIFENMPSSFVLVEVIYDKNNQPVDYKLLEANAEFDKQTGLKRKELIGLCSNDITIKLPDDIVQKCYKVALTGESFSYERFNESLNRYYHVRVASPQKGRFSLLFNDITQRRKADQEILELLNRFKQIAKHLSGFIYQFQLRNDNTFNFPYASKGITNIYGVSPEEAFEDAQCVFDVIHPDDLEKVRESIFKSAKYLTIWNESYRVNLPNGKTIWVEGKSTPIKNDDGSVLWHGYIQDITKRKNQEVELLKNRKLLKGSQRAGKIGSWELNLENNKLDFEEETYNIFGYSYEHDKLNQEIFVNNILHPGDRNYVHDMRIRIEKEKRFIDHEYRVIRKDGSERYVLIMGDVDLNNEGNVVRTYGIMQDITERKKQEQELVKAKNKAEENEKRLKAFKSSTTEGIFFSKNGICIDANEAACKMLGYSLEELIGMSGTELAEEESKEIVEKQIKANNEKPYDIVALRKDKSTFYGEIRGKLFDYYGDLLRVTAIRDITERKEQERELLIKQKLLLDSQRIAKVGSWELNLKSRELKWSEELYHIYGYNDTNKKPVLDDFLRMVHPDDDLIAKNNLINIFEKKILEDFECRIITSSGETKHIFTSGEIIFDKSGTPTHLYGIVQDRTNQKLYEEELIQAREIAEQNEKKLIIAQELAKLGSWELDIDSQMFTFSDNLFKIYHTSEEEVGSCQISSREYSERFVHPDDANLVAVESEKAVRTDDPNFTNYVEHRINFADGGIGYIGVRYFVIKDENGRTIKTFGVNQDITEKKKAEIELTRAKEKAEEGDRLKTAFLLNISHEIRTPMNGILGFMGLLAEPDLSEEQKSSYIKIINKSGERLINTINDIVEISRIEIGDIHLNYEPVNLIEVMQYHHDYFFHEIKEKGLDFEFKNQVTKHIVTDKRMLNGILMNLLKNAVKFTKQGKIEFGNYLQDDNICFFISDSGIGIPEDRREIIFNRFVQADTNLTRDYEGSGIGLSIVKYYIDALNGKIEVKSEVGKGSKFIVSIPLYKTNNTSANNENTNVFNQKSTILVAEDDEVSFLYIENLLSHNFTLIRAKNGEEAVNILNDNPGISAVLMDIKMSGQNDGIRAIKKIRAKNKNIPIIAQTAFAMNEDKERAFDAGCDEYLAKPFTNEELLSALKKVLDK